MMPDVTKKMILLGLATAACLGLAEMTLRVFYPTKSALYQLDERLIYRPIPGARRLFIHAPENGGEWIWIQINSDGFRGDPLREDDAAIRVAVYGDSCIMGEFSHLPDTYVQQLENALTERLEHPFEVINAGVVGYGPDQAILRMEEELIWLRPRLVILALFAHNDFGDLIRNRLFRLDADGTLQEQEYTLAPEKRAEFERAQWPILGKYAWLQFERFRSDNEADPAIHTPSAYKQLWKQDFRDAIIEGNVEVNNLLRDYYDADMALAPDAPSSVYKKELLTALLKRAEASARQAGAPLMIVIIPSPVDVCYQFDIQVDSARHPGYRRSTLSTLMEQSAGRAGILHLNLFPTFRQHPHQRLYFGNGDDHWNATGQRIAARTTADFIQQQFGVKGLAERVRPE